MGGEGEEAVGAADEAAEPPSDAVSTALPPEPDEPAPAPRAQASLPSTDGAAAPAAPTEAVTLTTPAPADGDGVVIVDVEPSPGALKFLGTVSNVGNQLSTLETSVSAIEPPSYNPISLQGLHAPAA